MDIVQEIRSLWQRLLYLEKRATVGGGGMPTSAHASRHEDGGDDEIDVTGLSGVLAEPQLVDVDPAGALDGDSATTPLAVRVDGVTIQINGSNELEAVGGGGGITQLTGDVTAGPGSGSQVATIANEAVTNAKAANMADSTIKGRASGAGTGDPTDLTADEVSTILDSASDPFLRTSAASAGTGAFVLQLSPLANEPMTSSPATPDVRNFHPVLDFDGATDEEAVFTAVLPNGYGGGGLTVDTFWALTSATSGSLRVQAAIERIDASSLDIDADSFASFNSAGGSAPGTSGHVIKVTITFTAGAQMDSLAAGELFRLKIRRDADGTSGTDDIGTDAELLFTTVRET